MDSYLKILSEITVYFSLFYPILYLKSFVSQNKAFKIFTLYLVLLGVIQLTMRMSTKVWELDSNLFLSHYYFIGQFILLSLFYVQLLKFRWIYGILAIVLLFLGYQYISNPELYHMYNPLGFFITHTIIVIYALLYMYRSLSGKKEFTLANIGIFMYLLSTALIFGSGNLIFNLEVPESFSQLLVDINKVLFLAFQILIFVEWWKNYSIPKTKS